MKTRNEMLAEIRAYWHERELNFDWRIIPVEISKERIVDGIFVCTEQPWKGTMGFTYINKFKEYHQADETELTDADLEEVLKGISDWKRITSN